MKSVVVGIVTRHADILNNWDSRRIDVRGKVLHINNGESFSYSDNGDGTIKITVISEHFNHMKLDRKDISTVILKGIMPDSNGNPPPTPRLPLTPRLPPQPVPEDDRNDVAMGTYTQNFVLVGFGGVIGAVAAYMLSNLATKRR
jgi:hypothetical protein